MACCNLAMGESNEAVGEHLPLREALVSFCDPALIDAVRREERRLTLYDHRQTGMPMLGAIGDLREPSQHDWMAAGSSHSAFFAAWKQLQTVFCGRIERQELFLTGVPLAPIATTQAEALPGAWVSQFRFDFDLNVVAMGDKRWGAVGVSTVSVTDALIGAPRSSDEIEAHSPATPKAEAGGGMELEPSVGRKKMGRPALGHVRLVDIATRIPRANSNKESAGQLLEEFARMHAEKPPAFATVVSHTARIYAEAAASAPSLKSQK